MAEIDTESVEAARQRQRMLTKPSGALGEMEAIAIRLAGMQRRPDPWVERISICVFAADHGIARQGVSAYPPDVTTEMVRNFARGGAAISVLARHHGVALQVVNLGTVGDTSELDGVINLNLGKGTADFTTAEAMSHEQLSAALQAGRSQVIDQELFIGGEMGIGNTTSATAMACALLHRPAAELAGPGTGIDAATLLHKIDLIERALRLHQTSFEQPLEILRRLGGFEIAALTGAYLTAAQKGVPVLVDGYISSVAALVAARLQPDSVNWFFFAHWSAEPGHRHVLDAMDAKPLLNLGMRLGEGSAAALALPLLQQACVLHNGMATFTEAAVPDKSD